MHEALMTVVQSRHTLHFNNYNFFAFLQNTLYLTLGYDDINRHTYQCELIYPHIIPVLIETSFMEDSLVCIITLPVIDPVRLVAIIKHLK